MEPILGSFRNRLRRRLAYVANLFRKLLRILIPQAQHVQSQRICPFCGLITSRYKTCRLECGIFQTSLGFSPATPSLKCPHFTLFGPSPASHPRHDIPPRTTTTRLKRFPHRGPDSCSLWTGALRRAAADLTIHIEWDRIT